MPIGAAVEITRKFAALLVAGCAIVPCLHAGSYVVICDPPDHGIGEGPPPFPTAATGNTIRVGATTPHPAAATPGCASYACNTPPWLALVTSF